MSASEELATNITPLHGRMTEAEYAIERERLRKLYGDSDTEAAAKRDQAWAILFHRSGWTQEELAKKEDKSQSWVDRRLRFGRFLNFTPMGVNSESVLNTLTERRFRSFWDRTEKDNGNERARFRRVIELMQEAPRPSIANELKQHFADGKWHAVSTIAKKLKADTDMVNYTLEPTRVKRYDCTVEKKQVGTETHYRLFKQDKMISIQEIAEKLLPILKGLEEQGQKNQVTMSVTAVAILSGKLRKLFDEWTE